MRLTSGAIEALERRHRAALINSVTGFKPAVLVGSMDGQGNSNLAIMSSLVHLGSHPPLLALVFRPDSTERHTLANIREGGVYTINHVHRDFIDAAHQTAARYPREVSEFSETGLTPHWEEGFLAPFVAESRVRLGMKMHEEHRLAVNGTHLLIGEIIILDAPDEAFNEDGALNPEAAGSVAISGLDSYHSGPLLQRMAYAKAELPPRRIG